MTRHVLVANAQLPSRSEHLSHAHLDVAPAPHAPPHAAQAERVQLIQPMAASAAMLARTLVCYVLVDPSTAHAFCSAYDMGPWPLLPHIHSLSAPALQVGCPGPTSCRQLPGLCPCIR